MLLEVKENCQNFVGTKGYTANVVLGYYTFFVLDPGLLRTALATIDLKYLIPLERAESAHRKLQPDTAASKQTKHCIENWVNDFSYIKRCLLPTINVCPTQLTKSNRH